MYNYPEMLDWRITSECDNNCPMCYACNNGPDISEEQIDIIISKLAQTNCKSICISGGEPTKSAYLEKIMRKLCEIGTSIFLSTNGYKFMDYREEIEPYIEKLSLPLDGYDERSNSANGRNTESFSRIINILEYYKHHNHKFSIKISTVLSPKTCSPDHLDKMLQELMKYDIAIWKIYEFIPESRGRQNKQQYSIYSGKFIEVEK